MTCVFRLDPRDPAIKTPLSRVNQTAPGWEPVSTSSLGPQQPESRLSDPSWSFLEREMTKCRSLKIPMSFFAFFFAAACTDGNPPETGYSVRDSAGVQILESAAPAMTSEEAWIVAPEPVLEIGTLEGPEEYTFDRIGGVLRVSDRQILVSNLRTNELRFYDLDGVFRRTVGGTGDGPGEFRSMRVWLGMADTLWVDDPRLARLTMLDPHGEFVKSVRIQVESEMGFPTAFGSSSDGGYWVTSATGGFGAGADGLLEGFEIFFSHYDSSGGLDRVITDFRGPPQWAHTSGGMTSANSLPHSIGWTVHAGSSNHLFLGTGVDSEVEVWNRDGKLIRLIRWEAAPRPVDGPEIEKFKEDFLVPFQGSDREEFWNGWLRDVPFPEVMPTFDKLIVDRTGHLWVRKYQPSWEDSQTWFTFNSDGRWLGEVGVPTTLAITDIGADYILGIWRDEMDVEYVRMYSLDRGN